MPTSAILRLQIEAALSERIPSALTSLPREFRPAEATNIHEIDELLQGGLPVGAISEIVGPESGSGMRIRQLSANRHIGNDT